MLYNFSGQLGFFATHSITLNRYVSTIDDNGLPVRTPSYNWYGRAVVTPTRLTLQQRAEGASSIGLVDIQVPVAVKISDVLTVDGVPYNIEDVKDFMAQGNFVVIVAREVK